MTDDTRSARYHANLAESYTAEAAAAKQNHRAEGEGAFNNRVGRLRAMSTSHAEVAQALALADIADRLYTLETLVNR